MGNGNSEKLFKAVADGDVVKMIEIINKLENENIFKVRDKKGRQLVHVASKKGKVKCLLELIKRRCDLGEKCFKGNNALHYACVSASLPCIIIILESGGSLRTLNTEGKTPLDLLPETKQMVFGNILRKAERRQKDMRERRKNQSLQDELSLASLLGEIPLLAQKGLTVNMNMELSRGPETSSCRGEFNTLPVMIKYNTIITHEQVKAFSLQNEILAYRNLVSHTNILQLLGVMWHDHQIQLVFEFPNFGYLHRALFQSKLQMNSSEILSVGRDVSNALQYIHAQGFLHCAVATYSVILSKTLQAKICNLNYVQRKSKPTSISHIPCLYPYMATKQRQGCPCDEKNDVHGLGVILYECATSCRIQNVEREMNVQNPKTELLWKMKKIPKIHNGAVATLIEACLRKVNQPTSLKVYEWCDAITGGRFVSAKPFDMENEELSRLQLMG